MILVDVNLLVYATCPGVPEHDRAREWFEHTMNSGQRVGLPWETLTGYARVASSLRSVQSPLSLLEAWEYVEGWLGWDMVWIPEPTANHLGVMGRLLRAVPKPRIVPDAHLAALAIEHGLTLCSNDADFRLFPDLRFHNPLE